VVLFFDTQCEVAVKELIINLSWYPDLSKLSSYICEHWRLSV